MRLKPPVRLTAGGIIKALMRLLVIAFLATLAWLWWKSGRPLTPSSAKPATNAAASSASAPVDSPKRAPETNTLVLVPPRSLSPTAAVLNPPTLSITSGASALQLIPTSRPLIRVVMSTNPPPPATAPPVATNLPVVAPAGPASATPAVSNITTATAATRADAEAKFQRTLSIQLALARLGFSPGSMDGAPGSQTRAALRAFQQREGLPATGEADSNTLARLVLPAEMFARYVVTEDDLARLRRIGSTWRAKSEQDRLDHETVLELVAEKFASSPKLLQRLNPGVDWTRIAAGTPVTVPAFEPLSAPGKATALKIFLGQRLLQALDESNRVIAQFPCSIAQRVEKRPAGETLRVVVAVPKPNYTFNPEVFPESAEGRTLGRKLILPPGPNNPVGLAWIGLDKSGYGIHGTPKPEEVGRTESHGCFRLANWNAEQLLKMVSVGTPIVVEP